MARLREIRDTSRWPDLVEGQGQHAMLAFLLGVGALSLLAQPVGAPRLLGLSSYGWAALSIALVLAHQVIVALVFRLELHLGLMTHRFGDRALRTWGTIFLPFLVARPLTLILVGWTDTTPITPWRPPEIALGLALLGVAGWTLHSVIVHFTIARALGGDHFRDDLAALPLVRKGAFAATPNAMYGLAFLGLWGISLVFGSWNALVVALFQHTYIWVHMYCTEAPDMARIHGAPPARTGDAQSPAPGAR